MLIIWLALIMGRTSILCCPRLLELLVSLSLEIFVHIFCGVIPYNNFGPFSIYFHLFRIKLNSNKISLGKIRIFSMQSISKISLEEEKLSENQLNITQK